MSTISIRFNSNAEEDIIWKICVMISSCICIIVVFIYFRTLQHLFCIPQSSQCSKFEPKYVKIYSTASITFAALHSIDILSSYLLCTQWECVETTKILWIFYLVGPFSYAMAKIFLYFILIGRLFNHYFAPIHQYPKYIKYLLYYMLICSIINLINGSTCVVLVLTGYDRAAAIFYVSIAVGAITDILLSLFCMVLCFRAIFSHNAKTRVFYVSVAKRQGFVAALQALVTISAECGYMLWVFLVLNGAALNVLQDYIYISNIVAMLDCMLLIICIYIGFARKSNTVCFSVIIEFRM